MKPKIYGLLAEYESPEALINAAKNAQAKGYRAYDAYSPFPVHGLDKAMGINGTEMPFMVFCGGMTGLIGGFLLQTWSATMAYPLNIGGRPYFSWPAFIPITFECGILCAAITAVFGMFIRNGLPQPYHPVFNSDRFAKGATIDRFFLCIESTDPLFDREKTEKDLQAWSAKGVEELEP